MSELKAIYAYTIDEVEVICNNAIADEYYIKSEADKAIEELKYKLDLYKRGWAENDKIIAYLNAELRNSNYKRCLAMAKWCLFWKNYWHCCEPTDLGAFIARERFFSKWQNRWLKIAEKFKHNNEVNNG